MLELLAPAKNCQQGIEAVNHGADAVYIGAPAFGARAAAVNTLADIEQLTRYAHIYPFGMNETAYTADNHSLKRAKLINYLYSTADYDTRKFQSILALDAMSPEQIWAEADKYWRELSVALKWSSLYNAYTMRTKLATLRAMRGLDITNKSRDYDTLSSEEIEVLAVMRVVM